MFPEFKIRKNVEFVTRCPTKECRSDPNWINKKKLEINLADDKFACWRCHYKGHALKLIGKYGKSYFEDYAKLVGFKVSTEVEKPKVELPKEYKFLLDNKNDYLGSQILEYFKTKNVSELSLLQNRVGFCKDGEYKDRIIFPSFDKDFNLNYFVTRHIRENYGYKWLKCKFKASDCIWNEPFVDWKRTIILTESVKTYLKFFDKNLNIVSNNGTILNKRYSLFSEILLNDTPSVVIAFDPEAKNQASEVAKSLWQYDCNVKIASFKKQPDELSLVEFQKEISFAKDFSLTNSLKERILNL